MSNALIVIDVQNDFCTGGGLAVPGGEDVVAGINAMMDDFDAVVLTQDWHPSGHSSFATSHEGAAPYDMMDMAYGPQVLWPDHCVQNTLGAAFHADLRTDADLILRKGFRAAIDSYSAFFENDQNTPTGLEGYLRNRGTAVLFMVVSFRMTEQSNLAPFSYFGIPFAFLLGWLFFDETPVGDLFPGAILIAAGGLLVIWRERQIRRRA